MSDNNYESGEPSAKRALKSNVLALKVERLLKIWKQQRDDNKKIMDKFEEIVSHSLERVMTAYQKMDRQSCADELAVNERNARLESTLEYIHRHEEIFNTKIDCRFEEFRLKIFGQTSEVSHHLSESKALSKRTDSILEVLKNKRIFENRIIAKFQKNIDLKIDELIGGPNEVVPKETNAVQMSVTTDRLSEVSASSSDSNESGTASRILSQELAKLDPSTLTGLFTDTSAEVGLAGVDIFFKIRDLWNTTSDDINIYNKIIDPTNAFNSKPGGVVQFVCGEKSIIKNVGYLKIRSQIALSLVVIPASGAVVGKNRSKLVDTYVLATERINTTKYGFKFYWFDPFEELVPTKLLPKWVKGVAIGNAIEKGVVFRRFGHISSRDQCFETCLKFMASVLDTKSIPSNDWTQT